MTKAMTSAKTFDLRAPLLLQLGLNAEAVPALQKYMSLLWAANSDLNLFSRQMPQQELVDNHLIDCLLPLSQLNPKLKAIADFGSGGGMPGVIYALALPETTVHLFEKSAKKRDFLKQCCGLAPNLQVHAEIPLEFKMELKNIELVTARAFKPLDVILELSRNYYGQKGKYFLLKGRREKIDEELLFARKKFKDLKAEIIPLKSPLLEVERHLVLI